MKLKLDIDPDIVAMMAAEVAAGERAVTAAMREAGTGLKTAWRSQITGAGLGRRLANSIRNQNFPRSGESLDAAAHGPFGKLDLAHITLGEGDGWVSVVGRSSREHELHLTIANANPGMVFGHPARVIDDPRLIQLGEGIQDP